MDSKGKQQIVNSQLYFYFLGFCAQDLPRREPFPLSPGPLSLTALVHFGSIITLSDLGIHSQFVAKWSYLEGSPRAGSALPFRDKLGLKVPSSTAANLDL